LAFAHSGYLPVEWGPGPAKNFCAGSLRSLIEFELIDVLFTTPRQLSELLGSRMIAAEIKQLPLRQASDGLPDKFLEWTRAVTDSASPLFLGLTETKKANEVVW